MKLTRREFLATVFTTVPAAALSGSLAVLWPEEGKARPVSDAVELALDEDGFLIEPEAYNRVVDLMLPTRSAHFGFDAMNPVEKAEFFCDWFDDEAAWELMDKPFETWTAEDYASMDVLGASKRSWLDAKVEIEEMNPRELAKDSEYGAAIELYDTLGPETAHLLGLRESAFGAVGSGNIGIHYQGPVEVLNQAFAAYGLNVVVRATDNS